MSVDIPRFYANRGDLSRAETMPFLTRRYAIPIHQSSSRVDSNGIPIVDPRPAQAENALRRKTPNGTLNAGYDGPADLLTPPVKHQLIPLSEHHAFSSVELPAPSAKRTFLQHQHQHQHHHQQQQQMQSVVFGGWSMPGAPGWGGSQYPQPQTGFPVMDSMLTQGSPPQHVNWHQYNGQTVPSVVQPSFQYLGPTASEGQGSGPYGPYWHDGTFVPYRPTAVREPRFYHQPTAHRSDPVQHPQLAHRAELLQQQNLAQNQWTPNTGLETFTSNRQTEPPNPAIGHVWSNSGQSFRNVLHSDPAHYASNSSFAHVPKDHSSGLTVDAEYGASSPNGRQRDKTFAWALQQYRELLSFIHQNRRQQQHTRQLLGQQQLPQRLNFYPKPPRQSSSSVSQQLSRSAIEPNIQNGDSEEAQPPTTTAVALVNSSGFNSAIVSEGTAGVPKTRSVSVWSPSDSQYRESENYRRASHDQYYNYTQTPPQPLIRQTDKFRTLRRSTGASVSANFSPATQDDSPPCRANVALQRIKALCQETDWQWIDGMHLGGCLAYGLGNYQRALRWYNMVLERDPKHLEATSNLAATLLALGQRAEAEKYWMQVVKVAPNHFEAVEHLVGLLCSQQRSKEAIKVIEYVERCLWQSKSSNTLKVSDKQSDCSSTASRSPCISEQSDKILYDFDADGGGSSDLRDATDSGEPGFGTSGFAIPGSDNGRILALIHAKGNMLYGLGDNAGAAHAFEDAVLIAVGRHFGSIQGLVKHILAVVTSTTEMRPTKQYNASRTSSAEPVLLSPDQALATAKLCFISDGELPGLRFVSGGAQSLARKAIISTTSNSLLSLAKIFQDGMSTANRSAGITPLSHGVRDILGLYYLSLSLQPSPSTANNVGILLASVQQTVVPNMAPQQKIDIPGVVPGSGIALALQYYNYGLQLDQHHAHLYTNLGSLLKDIGQLDAAINMYERAVKCDGKFDIALANLANAVKDKGRVSDAIIYYKRAVEVSPDFAEAVCGLANALNSVCGWHARGGIANENGRRDRWHVDSSGMLVDAQQAAISSSGWIKRVVDIVEKQLHEGENWGCGILTPAVIQNMVQQLAVVLRHKKDNQDPERTLKETLERWAGQKWEGARITRLVERATRRVSWLRYHDANVTGTQRLPSSYNRLQLPASMTVPTAPTVLPFHTFTCPMSAQQIRMISQRNGLRISVSTLRSPWLPKQVYPPPKPPTPHLRVGYVSSDFNNHPLAHLMQSVFGLHDRMRVEAVCYATTASDNSVHRQQIQREAPVFHDASSWSTEKLVNQIVKDGIHILVNLNGYTRGARNEVFAARAAPIQMSFMGFAGTLGAEWCDYLLADEMAIPPDTLRPWRGNSDIEDQFVDENSGGDNVDWVYGENIIYCRDTFFCCDHKQSAPDAKEERVSWKEEQKRRWQMRKQLFPKISDDTIILGNFNQLYKIEPTTFRTWLRILARVPKSILWLLRFPDLGESHLLATARMWAGAEVASRVIFTDVAPKHLHISRARVCDLVVDTAECNAHTTAADVLWSGTPILTLPRHPYKMCSRMAASILKGALPKDEEGERAASELIATSEEDYEEKAVMLGREFAYSVGGQGSAQGRLMELRKMLFDARWSSALFDTKRWVRDLEDAYDVAWKRWVQGKSGDIWLDQVPRGRTRPEAAGPES